MRELILRHELAVGTYYTELIHDGLHLDIRDSDQVKILLQAFQPDVIYIAAAQTSVDFCEEYPQAAFAVNVIGVRNIIRACYYVGYPKIVFFSTDYIFPDGGPWSIADIANPLQYYGLHKLVAEHYILGFYPKLHTIVRTSWVFGPGQNGFVQRLIDGGDCPVAYDQFGTPTYAPDLADKVVTMVLDDRVGLCHVSGPLTSRLVWANDVVRELNLSTRIIPVETKALGFKALRPLQAGLISIELPGHVDALKRMRKEIRQ